MFDALPYKPDFTSNRGKKSFSRHREDLRQPSDYGHGIFAETNLSANQIRDGIARLLAAFGLPERAFVVYLREDRDVG